jgi:serine protease AprX
MDEKEVKEARQRVHRRFGQAMATKASPELCLALGLSEQAAFAMPARAMFSIATAEGVPTIEVATPSAPGAVVLEFKPGTTGVAAQAERIAQARLRRSATRTASRQRRAGVEEVASKPVGESRQSRIQKAREEFFRSAADIRIEIERSSRGLHQPGPEAMASPQMPSSVADVCWLNQSLRTWVDPRSLAEIAGDDKIHRLDLPHRLEPEVIQVGVKLGVPEYRVRTSGTGKGVVVAVIDTEVAKGHPAFQSRVIPKHNYSRELWGNPNPHGTAVAGIIGGSGAEFAGIAPEVTIYNYKVLATNRFQHGEDFDGALALQQALEDGVQIANCSWGAGPAGNGSSREARACNAAWALGLTIVKSAGNAGPDRNTLTTPADAEGIIVVGATDMDCTAVQDYSSRGTTSDGRHRPHLVACGGSDDNPMISCLVGGGFGNCGMGTSFAAPHVTGILALMLRANPASTPDQLRADLLKSCKKLKKGTIDAQGAGVIVIH